MMGTMELNADGLGGSCELALDDELVVRLPENPTTGYRWTVAVVGDGLALDGQDFQPGGQLAGAGGQHTFRFVARGRGTATVRFTLERSFEPGRGETRELQVSVR